jgi:acyl carrier protein
MDRTFDRVKKIIVALLGVEPDKITMGADIREDLGADSLDLVELIMEFEEDFGGMISDEDAQNIRTVGDAVEYIQAHLSPKDREDTLDLDREYLLG